MLNFSKSKYCEFWRCPKMSWLGKYKPEAGKFDEAVMSRMDTGNEVGDLAMGLFGDFVEVTAYNDQGKIDIPKMLSNTAEEMAKGTSNICEASFSCNGLYCAVDILRKDGSGWAIYEVKSSTDGTKDIYAVDVAYQKYVLENCGVKVTGTFVVTLDSKYVFGGILEPEKLFKITDVSKAVAEKEAEVADNIKNAEKILSCPDEPDIPISSECTNPYECRFREYCWRDIPKPSVFDLYRMPFKKADEYRRKGITSFEELDKAGIIKNEKQLRQIRYTLNDLGTYADKDAIGKFLGNLSYPLYFLDFETMMPVIPCFKGTRPYQQIAFQYSLHYIESEGGELKHKEFLAESGTDFRRAIAERLCEDIPMNVCVTAFNKSFECTRIAEMAEMFPDLAEHLLNIKDNIVDLLVPFSSGYYYNKNMGGSFSIKSVLPAIFPDDPNLDYHNLDEVHNGGEAMNIFPKIKDMPPEEAEETRYNLLRYCELDTLAMVKVWEELVRVSK